MSAAGILRHGPAMRKTLRAAVKRAIPKRVREGDYSPLTLRSVRVNYDNPLARQMLAEAKKRGFAIASNDYNQEAVIHVPTTFVFEAEQLSKYHDFRQVIRPGARA